MKYIIGLKYVDNILFVIRILIDIIIILVYDSVVCF